MRSTDCRRYWSELIEIVEGKSRPEALVHVNQCSECASRLADLRTMVKLTNMGAYDAPAESIARARSIFTPSKRVVLAALSSQSSGARQVSSDAAQFRLSAEEVSVRVMRRRNGDEWQILGLVESAAKPISITYAGSDIAGDGSTFELTTSDLQGEVWLEFEDRVIRLPFSTQE